MAVGLQSALLTPYQAYQASSEVAKAHPCLNFCTLFSSFQVLSRRFNSRTKLPRRWRTESFVYIDAEFRSFGFDNPSTIRLCVKSHILVAGLTSTNRVSVFFPRLGDVRRSSRLHAKRPRRSWWKKLFFDEIEWWKEHNDEVAIEDIGQMMLEDEEVNSWKQNIDAINELRWYRKKGRDPNTEGWEDWLDESWDRRERATPAEDKSFQEQVDEIDRELLRKREEELRYLRRELESFGTKRKQTGPFSDLFQEPLEWHQENKFERGFARAAAKSTIKFIACLILIPWSVDFVIHDCLLVPFLNRYVQLVPLAAKVFDVTDTQMSKKVIPPLKDEELRLTFQAEIGLAPPLSAEELREHLHQEALERVEEVRAENRSNFANVWSDMLAGLTLLLLLMFNPMQVELMTYSGIRLFSNLSDIGKAFFIILFSDIFLGYHSESGWITVVELFLEHYGMKATEASISSFVAIVPVTIDACFKLWVFRNLPRLSPSLTAIFREMERH